MKTKLLIILIASIILFGCGSGKGYYEYVYCEHFILRYPNTQMIEIYNGFEGNDKSYADFYYDQFGCQLVTIYTRANGNVDKEEYEELCIKHDDIDYNREVRFLRNIPSLDIHSATTNLDFVSISIISDAEFDEEHSIGDDLGDIVRFRSSSPIKYIQSGYVDKYTYISDNGETIESLLHPVYKLVSELTAEDMVLLSAGRDLLAELHFFSDPTISKVHNITVTMTSDNGRVFQDTIRVSWE